MRSHLFKSDIAYVRGLVGAGLDGIASARHSETPRRSTPPSVFLTPTALGAAFGALGTRLVAKRKSRSALVMGGLVGSLVGAGAAIAWASRGLLAPAARFAFRNVSAARDAHWLETNPIDYA